MEIKFPVLVIFAAIFGSIFWGFGFLIGDLAIKKSCDTPNNNYLRDADDAIRQKLSSAIDAEHISDNLKFLSSSLHRAGTPESLNVADWIANKYRSFGHIDVDQPEYDVLLSYPNNTNPNTVHLKDGSNWIEVSNGTSHYYRGEVKDDVDPDADIQFNAYARAADVTASCVVYANYGRYSDFLALYRQNVTIEGCIVLARYGWLWRGAKVQNSQRMGGIGTILYTDPYDYSNNHTSMNETFPHNIYMPPSGTQRGTIAFGLTGGDYATEFIPAKNYSSKLTDEMLRNEGILPDIPATPISYSSAKILLEQMSKSAGSTKLPPGFDSWQGTATDMPYVLKSPTTVRLAVHTKPSTRKIRNTIGYIKGSIEPDRYVLLGNHHDAWVYGGIDPSSGTAVLVETVRAIVKVMNETGWRPRRTLVFCSWDSEEYGLVGSGEWVEENFHRLQSKAVAYMNIDIAVQGNLSFHSSSVPGLKSLVYEVTQTVPNPNTAEVAEGRKTVYDTWLHVRPDGTEPKVALLGSGSDYATFLDYVGVPAIDLRYTGTTYPLYHTMYETYFLEANLVDRGFKCSQAVSRVWAEMARRLSDDLIIPFDFKPYASFLLEAAKSLKNNSNAGGRTFDYVISAANELVTAVDKFHSNVKTLKDSNGFNEINVRKINEKLIIFERNFIIPPGLPLRPHTRHSVFAPSTLNSYAGVAFSGISDSLSNIKPSELPYIDNRTNLYDKNTINWNIEAEKQIDWVVYCIKSAAAALIDDY